MALNFSMTYDGQPFLLDQAKVARHPPVGINPGMNRRWEPPRKHQPEFDLFDEINRLIDTGYLDDQQYPQSFPGKNIAAVASRRILGQYPNPKVKLNCYFYPTGAQRWSIFRGLMTSTAIKTILADTAGGNPAAFVMQASTGSTNATIVYQISTNLYLLPPRPIGEVGGNNLDGLYLVTLVDERYFWQYLTTKLHVTASTTWVALGNQILAALDVTGTINPVLAAYTAPEPDSQLWTNHENAAYLFDALALNLGGTVVRQYDGTYNIYQPIFSRDLVYGASGTNRIGSPSIIRTAGGDLFSSGEKIPAGNLTAAMNTVLPPSVIVTFPRYVQGMDPVPHFCNTRYATSPRPTAWYEDSYGDVFEVTVPLLSGGLQFSGQLGVFISGSAQLDNQGNPYTSSGLIGVSGFQPVINDTAKATYDTDALAVVGGDPTNVSGLTSLAMQLAYDFYNQQIDAALDEVYPGIIQWTPEGIHDILWTYSARDRQGTTRVFRSPWNAWAREMQHSTPYDVYNSDSALSGYLGGHTVAQTWTDQSGHFVPTVNHVLLQGGVVSGRLYSGGISQAIVTVQPSGFLTLASGTPPASGTYYPLSGATATTQIGLSGLQKIKTTGATDLSGQGGATGGGWVDVLTSDVLPANGFYMVQADASAVLDMSVWGPGSSNVTVWVRLIDSLGVVLSGSETIIDYKNSLETAGAVHKRPATMSMLYRDVSGTVDIRIQGKYDLAGSGIFNSINIGANGTRIYWVQYASG